MSRIEFGIGLNFANSIESCNEFETECSLTIAAGGNTILPVARAVAESQEKHILDAWDLLSTDKDSCNLKWQINADGQLVYQNDCLS